MRSAKITIQQKVDSGATTESALIGPLQKAVFSESIFSVVLVILREKTSYPLVLLLWKSGKRSFCTLLRLDMESCILPAIKLLIAVFLLQFMSNVS